MSWSTVSAQINVKDVWEYIDRHLTSTRTSIYITNRYYTETLLTTPQPLPSSRPTTPQISITLTNDKFPSFSTTPYSVMYIMHLMVGGRNFSTNNQGGLNVEVNINDELANVFAGVINPNNYYTYQIFLTDVKVGDTIKVYLWSEDQVLNWDYYGYLVMVGNIIPVNALYWTIMFDSVYRAPTKGSPSIAATKNLWLIDAGTWTLLSDVTSGRTNFVYPYVILLRTGYGITTPHEQIIRVSTTNRPVYDRQALLSWVIVIW